MHRTHHPSLSRCIFPFLSLLRHGKLNYGRAYNLDELLRIGGCLQTVSLVRNHRPSGLVRVTSTRIKSLSNRTTLTLTLLH